MQCRAGSKIGPWMVLVGLLLIVPLSAWGEEESVNMHEGDNTAEAAEPMSRLQIAREHHLVMQQIIDSLSETVGLLRYVAEGDGDRQKLDEVQEKIRTLRKKIEALSEKHQYLMEAIEISREASINKKSEEEGKKLDKDATPHNEP